MNNAKKVKVLIVEDDVLLALDAKALLSSLEYEVVGIAPSADKAIKLLKHGLSVDIILIDIIIQGDKDGIEFARIINKEYQIPFVFFTSHSESNLLERVKSVRPYGYLLKPINREDARVAIELALSNFSDNIPEDEVNHRYGRGHKMDNQTLKISDSLFLKKNQHFQRVILSEIFMLEAENNYTMIYSKSDKFLYSTVLGKMEEKLPSDQFLRVHRSYIVNIQCVTGFEGNMLFIGEKRIPVSKQYRERVFGLFKLI